MKKQFLIVFLLVGFTSMLKAQTNSADNLPEQIYKFINNYPCMEGLIQEGKADATIDKKGYAVITIKKTGVSEYDAVGGLGFFNSGIVYKINQSKSLGTWTCKGQYKLHGSDGSNTKTILSAIEILWQTDENGNTLSTASGIANYRSCSDEPLPHNVGCYSNQITNVQACLPGIEPNGTLDKPTLDALEKMGFDMSGGLTEEIYNAIMIENGKPLYKPPVQPGQNKSREKVENMTPLSPRQTKEASIHSNKEEDNTLKLK